MMPVLLSADGEFPQLALVSVATPWLAFDAHFKGLIRITAIPAICAGPSAVDTSLQRETTTGATPKRRRPRTGPVIRALAIAQPRSATGGSTVILGLWATTDQVSMTFVIAVA
jgi:hypothetical protein